MIKHLNWTDLLDSALGDVRRLDYVDRFSSIPVTLRETVSSHSYWVSLYSVMIHRFLGGDNDLLGAISLHAITHDLAEALTGDVVRPFKYSSEVLKKAIDDAEDVMVRRFPLDVQGLYPLWELMAGEKKSYVKAVVKAADFLSLFQYLNRERLRGNREINDFINRMEVDLKMTGNKVKEDPDPSIASLYGIYFSMTERIGMSGSFST